LIRSTAQPHQRDSFTVSSTVPEVDFLFAVFLEVPLFLSFAGWLFAIAGAVAADVFCRVDRLTGSAVTSLLGLLFAIVE
jgi:hypothetical protein